MTNHLVDERSRYLQQHADNPVDWYPWGEAAFERAREEDKPIFLSIGYSACHWCHVMAHESFEDAATADLLNEHFVSIKVDREERPDLDRIYMGAVQALTGRGGWPMSVFCTPEGEPFYGGTYFPKEPRPGVPSFTQVLRSIIDAWEQQREKLLEGGEQVVAALQGDQVASAEALGGDLRPSTLEDAYQRLRRRFDAHHGGWGGAPKFPQPMALEFLLRYHHTTEDPAALSMVTQTLEAMARGGVYDQLGGGFHRYAVDARWQTPHFERMLYDNAQLARVYLHAWQVTGAPFFRAIAEEVLDYVAREMTAPEGGFYATQDADTEGEEGKFYTWTPDQIREVLGASASRFMELYGVTERGNFEGKNILTFQGEFEARQALARARQQLFEARERRTPPGRDEKVLTSWNGLMLAAFAEAARALGRADYREVAQRNADFLLRELRDDEGRLWHVWHAGPAGEPGEAQVRGLLEDHTHLIEGLLALYQTDFNPRWYRAAEALASAMFEDFSAGIGFYDTADDVETLVVRLREVQDNATPSGNAMAATVLQTLTRFGAPPRYAEAARHSLGSMQRLMGDHPLAFGQWLVAQDSALATSVEVAIVGAPDEEAVGELVTVAQAGYHPHRLVAVGSGTVPPLLVHRERVEGQAAAHVCKAQTCEPPVVTPKALGDTLA
jgi:hypothetical protein